MVCLFVHLEVRGKEGLVPLITTRWQHCPGRTQNGLVVPSSPQRKGPQEVEFEPKA